MGREKVDPAAPSGAEAPTGVRLQKVLAQAGVSSRRGGEALIADGRVEVNDRVVTEPGTRVDPIHDRICVDGRAIAVEPPMVLLINKPDGVTTTDDREPDARGRPSVLSLLRGVTQRVLPIGRLDFHSRGALLLSNDGTLSARLRHPKYDVERTFHAKFQGRLETDALQRLSDSVTLDDGTKTRPATEVVVVRETEANTWVQIALTHAVHRQLRRMGEAIGHPVLKLIRVSFADLTIDGLADGDWRSLTPVETARLYAQVDLRHKRNDPTPAGPGPKGGGRRGSRRPRKR